MSIRIEIFDGTTPLLEKIQILSHGMALEMLSVAGSHIQREARVAMIRKKHSWLQHIGKHGRVILKSAGATRQLGLRISHENGALANPSSMSNMITSYLMEKSMTVVIGGRHPRNTPNKRRGGIVVGKMGSVAAVSKETQSILHKLNFGGTLQEQLPEYNRGAGRGSKSMAGFKNVRYKGYNFMEEGYIKALPSVVDAMTRRYESLLHKAVNRADIKVRRRSS